MNVIRPRAKLLYWVDTDTAPWSILRGVPFSYMIDPYPTETIVGYGDLEKGLYLSERDRCYDAENRELLGWRSMHEIGPDLARLSWNAERRMFVEFLSVDGEYTVEYSWPQPPFGAPRPFTPREYSLRDEEFERWLEGELENKRAGGEPYNPRGRDVDWKLWLRPDHPRHEEIMRDMASKREEAHEDLT